MPLVVDATQTVGHGELPRSWSVLAADARTWGGPTVGVLAVRTGVRWRSPCPADDRGRASRACRTCRAIVAAAASLRAVVASGTGSRPGTARWSNASAARSAAAIPDVEVLGDPQDRLPHIVTFSCLYVDGEALLTGLDRRGFAVSSGSSCTSSTLSRRTCSSRWARSPVATCGSRCTGTRPTPRWTRSSPALPEVVADVRAELGAAGL